MNRSNEHSGHAEPEAGMSLAQLEELRHRVGQGVAQPEEPLSRFRHLLNANREATRLRQENKHRRVDPFQTLVYECLPEDGTSLPFPLLCLLVTGRLHSRFPTKSDKLKISEAVHNLENHGMVTSERVSTRELRKQGYNLPGFYCKMIGKKQIRKINGFSKKKNGVKKKPFPTES
jgi:hypothetical protein